MRFQVNPKAPGDVWHAPRGPYRKGEIYDSEALKLPAPDLSAMLKMTVGRKGPRIFQQVEED